MQFDYFQLIRAYELPKDQYVHIMHVEFNLSTRRTDKILVE